MNLAALTFEQLTLFCVNKQQRLLSIYDFIVQILSSNIRTKMNKAVEENLTKLPRIALIACGCFSPPTPMHFRLFEIARDYFEMQGTHTVVGGIMSPTNDLYGKKGLANGNHRYSMLRIGLRYSDWIKVSDWEIKQSHWCNTLSVLEYHQNFMNNCLKCDNIHEENGNLPEWLPTKLFDRKDCIQLRLLCGADLLESFAVPGLWADEDIERIVSNHGLVVISRFGSNPEKFIFESDILTKYQRNITLITNWVPNEVSSSLIRRLLKRGQSVKYLLDEDVLDYIKINGLFEYKSKYITSDLSPPSHVFLSPNNNNYNQVTPTSDYDIKDDHSGDFDDEIKMDESDYSIKNIMTKFYLDNRSSSVFCCGDTTDSSDQKKKKSQKDKLVNNRNVPGLAIQVVATETSNGSRTEKISDSQEMQTKKMRIQSAQYV